MSTVRIPATEFSTMKGILNSRTIASLNLNGFLSAVNASISKVKEINSDLVLPTSIAQEEEIPFECVVPLFIPASECSFNEDVSNKKEPLRDVVIKGKDDYVLVRNISSYLEGQWVDLNDRNRVVNLIGYDTIGSIMVGNALYQSNFMNLLKQNSEGENLDIDSVEFIRDVLLDPIKSSTRKLLSGWAGMWKMKFAKCKDGQYRLRAMFVYVEVVIDLVSGTMSVNSGKNVSIYTDNPDVMMEIDTPIAERMMKDDVRARERDER